MSYASVEDQKQRGALDVARERSRGGLEIAGVGLEGEQYKADQTLAGTERYAQAREFGDAKSSEASMYGADRTLEAALSPKISYGYSESRAGGGPVAGKLPYLVGEKGKELFVPEQNGRIIPNHRLQKLLKKRGASRAVGGPVEAGGQPNLVAARPVPAPFNSGGGGDLYSRSNARQTAAQTQWQQGAAPNLEYKKNLMEAQKKIDPTGAREYHRAAAQPYNRAEDDAVRGDFGNQFNEFYKANTGAALPKAGEPDFPDYHDAHEVAKRFGPQAAEKFHHESQKVKQYKSLFTPEAVAGYRGTTPDKAAGFLEELAKNPADYRKYMLEHGPALQKTAPAAVVGTERNPGTAMQQLGVLGKSMTPDWMTHGYYERTHPKR